MSDKQTAVEKLVGELDNATTGEFTGGSICILTQDEQSLSRVIAIKLRIAIAADKASAALESERREISVEVQNAFDKTEVAVAFAHEIAEEFCGGSEAVEECILAKMFEYDMRRRAAAPQQAAGERSAAEQMGIELARSILNWDQDHEGIYSENNPNVRRFVDQAKAIEKAAWPNFWFGPRRKEGKRFDT